MNQDKTITPYPDVDAKHDSMSKAKGIGLRNRPQGYGLIAICLHWLVTLVVIGMFILGVWMTDLTYYDVWYKKGPDIHRSIGVLLFFVLIFRIYWRVTNVTPDEEPNSGELQKRVAHSVHLILYFMLLAMMLSGYLISTADGRAIEVFGLFEVPAIPPLNIENLEDRAGEVHWYLALILAGLVGLHALAALKHHFINRDRTLAKMLGIRTY